MLVEQLTIFGNPMKINSCVRFIADSDNIDQVGNVVLLKKYNIENLVSNSMNVSMVIVCPL
ncbi:MAG: hypothetical protein COB98_03555 [Flavobacteriaceae bacterium]|nr:MAG: hypothetical protein COB98_03555 [Flavobacteriaceae bacterium]